jgi:exodeoxyribonuclease III
MLKLITWNVNGIRAAVKKDFWTKVQQLDPDILCLQEIKCGDAEMLEIFGHEGLKNGQTEFIDNYTTSQNTIEIINTEASTKNNYIAYWHTCRLKKGYSGTAIILNKRILSQLSISKIFKEFGNDSFDREGRLVALQFKLDNSEYVLLNGYYPQGGREGRVLYKTRFYEYVYNIVNEWLQNDIQVILCGDLNTTITDIDLARPKENRNTTGCLPEERVVLQWLISTDYFKVEQLQIANPDFYDLKIKPYKSLGLIDCFRHFYPDLTGVYTYWDQITRARERNVGWRIDYFLISKKIQDSLISVTTHTSVFGSDHCPVEIVIDSNL